MEAGVDLLEVQKISILLPAFIPDDRFTHIARNFRMKVKRLSQLTVQFQLDFFPANRFHRIGFKLREPVICDLNPRLINMFRVEFQISDPG